jgi:2',3'-cyclic-nucleotide 2'-phosphodiesterase (5'-nucleotidase family)
MTFLLTTLLLVLAPQDSLHVRVLAMNDFHGAIESRTYPWTDGRVVGGAAVLKAAMDSAEAQCRCLTLRVDAGDEMQGTLTSNMFYGASTVEAFNLLGLDAAAIGNHEFDWGVDTLRHRLREAQYPWLVANVFDSVTGRRPDWARPYHITEFSGLRVAFIGFVTPTAKRIVYPPYVAGLAFGSGKAAIEDVLDAVRAERPDLTILTAHAGLRCNDDECRGEIVSLARELDRQDVDLIVAGHPHVAATTEVNGIPIVQSGSSGTHLGVVDLFRNEGGRWRAEVQVRTVYADEVTPDAAMMEMLSRYQRITDALGNRTVATLKDAPVTRDGENELGNIIADAQRYAARADVAIINNGGIRTVLPAGPVTYGMLYALQPFQNEVVRLSVDGTVLRQLLEQTVGTIHVSGMRITYDPARPRGSRITEARLADGRRIVEGRTYTLGLVDFLAAGAAGFTILADLPSEKVGLKDLDALIAHLQSAPQPFAIPHDRRIVRVGG